MLSLEEKLDEALKDTFPASDAFYLAPDDERSRDAGPPPPAAARSPAPGTTKDGDVRTEPFYGY